MNISWQAHTIEYSVAIKKSEFNTQVDLIEFS